MHPGEDFSATRGNHRVTSLLADATRGFHQLTPPKCGGRPSAAPAPKAGGGLRPPPPFGGNPNWEWSPVETPGWHHTRTDVTWWGAVAPTGLT